MLVLGIESSCDECSASVVEDGRHILSNIIATQVDIHRPYSGVVPEIASRTHTEWIVPVVEKAIKEAGISEDELGGVGVTFRPGLIGSLLVGVSFAKAYAYSRDVPFVGVDHILAHLYAPRLEHDVDYPFLGLLVSGGHTIICVARAIDDIEVLGTTIDDACGEAFDKIAKFYDFGYPGGVAVDRLAQSGDPTAFDFPYPSLHKGDHRYDVSYSGLKTAVVNQLEHFRKKGAMASPENIAASFQRAAIGILITRLERAITDTGIRRVVAGGGVVANSQLRQRLLDLQEQNSLEMFFPSATLCTDNGAMIAGLAYHLIARGDRSPWSLTASARVAGFRKNYP
jgi:N6-L-threonylcarbamoyladenine synthase